MNGGPPMTPMEALQEEVTPPRQALARGLAALPTLHENEEVYKCGLISLTLP